jgi:hypothetical protein
MGVGLKAFGFCQTLSSTGNQKTTKTHYPGFLARKSFGANEFRLFKA